MLRFPIDFGRLNLPIIAKIHKKSCSRIACSCSSKIEAGQIHKLWRSLELRICNFLKNYLTTSTICMSERTAFVVFLEKSKVRIPLLYMHVVIIIRWDKVKITTYNKLYLILVLISIGNRPKMSKWWKNLSGMLTTIVHNCDNDIFTLKNSEV